MTELTGTSELMRLLEKDRSQQAVAITNVTDFLRPHKSGRLNVVATPIQQGARSSSGRSTGAVRSTTSWSRAARCGCRTSMLEPGIPSEAPLLEMAGPERSRVVTWPDPMIYASANHLSGRELLQAIVDGLLPPPPMAQLVGAQLHSGRDNALAADWSRHNGVG